MVRGGSVKKWGLKKILSIGLSLGLCVFFGEKTRNEKGKIGGEEKLGKNLNAQTPGGPRDL